MAERQDARMVRRAVVMIVALAMGVAASCTTPTPGAPGRYACADSPVDLGDADAVEAVSDDGDVIVLTTYSDGDGVLYEVIDRRADRRYTMLRTSPDGDGAAIYMDAAGSRVIGRRYPALAPGESEWFVHYVGTDIVADLDLELDPSADWVRTFSSDLTQAVVSDAAAADGRFRSVDVASGEQTPLGLANSSSWRVGAFSPDTSLALQYSSASGLTRSLRVVDSVTGAVVRDLGQIRNESSWNVAASFVDDGTVLVDNAVPLGAPSDGVADDGAFVVDVETGVLTRIDPGVAGASTVASTADGSRSLFSSNGSSWIRLSPNDTRLVTNGYVAGHDRDLAVVVAASDDRLTLNCY